jgi:hypothetical protein
VPIRHCGEAIIIIFEGENTAHQTNIHSLSTYLSSEAFLLFLRLRLILHHSVATSSSFLSSSRAMSQHTGEVYSPTSSSPSSPSSSRTPLSSSFVQTSSSPTPSSSSASSISSSSTTSSASSPRSFPSSSLPYKRQKDEQEEDIPMTTIILNTPTTATTGTSTTETLIMERMRANLLSQTDSIHSYEPPPHEMFKRRILLTIFGLLFTPRNL